MKNSLITLGIAAVAAFSLVGCGATTGSNQVSKQQPGSSNETQTNTATSTANVNSTTVKLTTNEQFEIYMIDSHIGWGIIRSNSQSIIVRTTDGGKTWHDVSSKDTGAGAIRGFEFLSTQQASFTVQPGSQSATSDKPDLIFYHTQNGGKTWQSSRAALSTKVPVQGAEISTVNASTVYMDVIPQHGMNSMPGYLMVSHDGGQSWESVQTPNNIPMGGAVKFTTATKGWLSSSNTTTTRQRLFETTDSGKSWTEDQVPISAKFHGYKTSVSLPQFSSSNKSQGTLQVIFETHGGVVKGHGVYSTSNGGKTWTFSGEAPLAVVTGKSSSPSPNVEVAMGTSTDNSTPKLYLTTNGAKSWTHFALPTSPFVNLLKDYRPTQIDFISQSVGWIVLEPRTGDAKSPQVWETKDGGHSWIQVLS